MFKNIKLKKVSWIFTFLLLTVGVTLVGTTIFLQTNVAFIKSIWIQYQADRSEKARLESSLRSAIGYGGMIHDFKNFILRHDQSLIRSVNGHIGAAKAVISQYSAIQVTETEKMALEDINVVLENYNTALIRAAEYIENGMSTTDLDKMLKVDDDLAFRGLAALQREVIKNVKNSQVIKSKGRILADIRAAIGYGGMIHEFKNFILRQDKPRIEKIRAKINIAKNNCQSYLKLQTSTSEKIALDDIMKMLSDYENGLNKAVSLTQENASINEIDSLVKINDKNALRGLVVLDREIAIHIDTLLAGVDHAFDDIKRFGKISTFIVVLCIASIIFFLTWLIHSNLILPIQKLIGVMEKLTKEHFKVSVPFIEQTNEIGRMAQAIAIFKENLIERKRVESNLVIANSETNKQLIKIQELKEQAELQAKNSMQLVENLAEAKETTEKAMAESEQQGHYVRSVLDTVSDAVISIDHHGIIETFNPRAESSFGYKSQEVIGKNVSILMPEPHKSQHNQHIKDFFAGKSTKIMGKPLEYNALRKDGQLFPVEITLNTLQIGDSNKFTGVARDITDRKKAEKEIRRLALYDPLTSLANRNQFDSRLEDAIKLANRTGNSFALLLLDLDKFKQVNDTYGHHIGDEVLKHVATVLKECSREIDTAARMGGDEFAIIVTDIAELRNADIPAKRVIDELDQSMMIEGNIIQIGISIGISFYPQDSKERVELFQQADKALYKAKEEGRNTFIFFSQLESCT